MRKITIVLCGVLCLSLFACSKKNSKEKTSTETVTTQKEEDKIFINGKIDNTIEVKTSFNDEGVTYPKDKYTLITKGKVDTNKIGEYELVYSVYSSDGVLVKEMHRFVNVVDTQAPTYTENTSISDYMAGKEYKLSDFISSYTDNYDSNIAVSKNTFVFYPGSNTMSVSFTDSSNNTSTYTKNINATIDMWNLINDSFPASSITIDTIGTSIECIRAKVDSKATLSYYKGSTLHYVRLVTTELGTYASIQVSARYGQFSNATVDYYVLGSGSDYSTGFAKIDALNTNSQVSSFSSMINNLDLDTTKMLEELNAQLPEILTLFHTVMNEVLGIKVI